MADDNDSKPTPLGIYDRAQQPRVTGIEEKVKKQMLII